ncbi:MAG: YgeY family selenium metabolism-linked hydrolase [Planctomycetota bacterium]|jgi:putative selenium metabolism hydrolase
MSEPSGPNLLAGAKARRDEVAGLLRRLISIPSFSGKEGALVEWIAKEMERRGFCDVSIDAFGNVSGRLGTGKRLIAFDAHIDTVEPGEMSTWSRDPFSGEEENGVIFGRGAADQKGGMAALLLAGTLVKTFGLPDSVTLLVVGSVQEEDCDGLCWQYIFREEGVRPEGVILTEPTGLGVHRGQRGRVEMEIDVKGISCHGSAPHRGVNAATAAARIALEVDALNGRLPEDPFLGKGSVAVTRIRTQAPSLCAVPDGASLHLDRRLTAGETPRGALEEVRALPAVRTAGATVRIPEYAAPTHTGMVYRTRAEFPTWVLPEDHGLVQKALLAARDISGREGRAGHWGFSTNGVATAGLFGIPTVGFGPGEERFAHGPEDQVPVAHLVEAAATYAWFPWVYAGKEDAHD